MVRVSVGVRGVMGRERRAAGRGGTGGGIARITGSSCRGVAVCRLAHLRAGAQVAVTALHLAGGQGAAGRFEAGGRRCRGLVQIRVVHDDAVDSGWRVHLATPTALRCSARAFHEAALLWENLAG